MKLCIKQVDILENYEKLLKIEKIKIIEKEIKDIPEDYLDPITNEIINNVIILPSSKKKMDLNVIKKHLLYHNFDPFNRDKLSLEELEKYNEEKKIKEECNEFMKDLNEWKIKFL